MMTVYQLALRLIKYIGRVSLDPSDPSNLGNPMRPPLVAGDLEDVLAAINGALQELWDLAPTAWRYKRIGVAINAPTAVAVDVLKGERAVVVHGFEPWMAGCSIDFGGIGKGELVSKDELFLPWRGSDATGLPATVYHDSVELEEGVIEVVGPVEIPEGRFLTAVESRAEFLRACASSQMPEVYHLEMMGIRPRMLLRPRPSAAWSLSFQARMNAPTVEASDVGAAMDAGRIIPLPGGWHEGVLLPFALKRYSAHPAFGAGNALSAAEIDRQYKAAIKMARGASPSRQSGKMIPVFR